MNELQTLNQDASLLLTKAQEVADIKNVDQESRAVEFLAQTKRRFKLVDGKFKEYVKPLKNSIKAMKADFDPIKDQLNEAERIVKNGMRAFRDSEDFKRKEQERIKAEKVAKEIITEAVKEGNADCFQVAKEAAELVEEAKAEAPKTVNTQSGQARYRKSWKFEIENPDLVNRILCTPDLKLIRAAVKSGVREIEGVRIWEETTPIIMS